MARHQEVKKVRGRGSVVLSVVPAPIRDSLVSFDSLVFFLATRRNSSTQASYRPAPLGSKQERHLHKLDDGSNCCLQEQGSLSRIWTRFGRRGWWASGAGANTTNQDFCLSDPSVGAGRLILGYFPLHLSVRLSTFDWLHLGGGVMTYGWRRRWLADGAMMMTLLQGVVWLFGCPPLFQPLTLYPTLHQTVQTLRSAEICAAQSLVANAYWRHSLPCLSIHFLSVSLAIAIVKHLHLSV